MNNLTQSFTILLIATTVFTSACKKQKEVDPKEEETTEDYLTLHNDMNSVDESVSDAEKDNGNNRVAAKCFNFVWNKDTAVVAPGFGNNYRKYTINYSGGSCDSLERRGELIVYRNGSILAGNYSDSVVFSSFNLNGRSIEGYRVFKLQSKNMTSYTGNYSVRIFSQWPNGKTFSYVSSGQKEIANYLTPMFTITKTTGSTQVKNKKGQSIAVEILSPIIINNLCLSKMRFPVQGSVRYTNTATGSVALVDYGIGKCDRLASLTYNGNTNTFILK